MAILLQVRGRNGRETAGAALPVRGVEAGQIGAALDDEDVLGVAVVLGGAGES